MRRESPEKTAGAGGRRAGAEGGQGGGARPGGNGPVNRRASYPGEEGETRAQWPP